MNAMQPPFTSKVLSVYTTRDPTVWNKERMQGCVTVVIKVQERLLVILLMKERRICLTAWHKSMEKSFKGLMVTSQSSMTRLRPRNGGLIRAASRRILSGNHVLRWRSREDIMQSLTNSLFITTKTKHHRLLLPLCHSKKCMWSKNPLNI
jgi:hypothetical protein